MKSIILRGLPGCGKSVIAEKLSEKLKCKVIQGDFFKREFMIANSNCKNEEIYKHAHDKVLKEFEKMFVNNEKLIIIEELFENKEFVKKINKFAEENYVEMFWFYIHRNLEKLLEIEKNRKRKVKNTREDFVKLQKDLDSIKNEKEIIIGNNGDLNNTISFILKNLENKILN